MWQEPKEHVGQLWALHVQRMHDEQCRVQVLSHSHHQGPNHSDVMMTSCFVADYKETIFGVCNLVFLQPSVPIFFFLSLYNVL